MSASIRSPDAASADPAAAADRESDAEAGPEGAADKEGSRRYFGVRSHLHELYDYGDAAAASSETDDTGRGPLLPAAGYCKRWAWRRGARPCAAFLWLALMWLGVFSLFAGLALMLAGYAVPRQAAVIGYASLSTVVRPQPASAAPADDDDDTVVLSSPKEESTPSADALEAAAAAAAAAFTAGASARPVESAGEPARDLLLVDRSALDLNAALDACKVAGLVTLCSGGLVLVLVLAAPLARPFSMSRGGGAAACCDRRLQTDGGGGDDDLRARDRLLGRPVAVGQTDKVIPAAHFVAGVQPQLKPD